MQNYRTFVARIEFDFYFSKLTMKKILLLFAVLTLSAGLWAQETQSVNYIDENGVEQTVDAIVVTNATDPVTWGAVGTTSWYIVIVDDDMPFVQLSQGAVCAGDVRLILADAACLIATAANNIYTPGIQVSGEGNSLTIYGQLYQYGRLETYGGMYAAGIGGRYAKSGDNITINGGTVVAHGGTGAAGIGGGANGSCSNITFNNNVTINSDIVEVGAYGGAGAAGIGGGENGSCSNITINGGRIIACCGTDSYGAGAAGIGGGKDGSCSNITINGGRITANGGNKAAGIGGGHQGSGSNITVVTSHIVKAGDSENPTTEIAVTRTSTTDIANDLAGKRYVEIEQDPYLDIKAAAVAEIDAAIEGVTDASIIAIATTAKTNIFFARTIEDINSIKTQALADIVIAKSIIEINAAIDETDNDNVKAVATHAATAINAAETSADVNTIKTFALAAIASARAAYIAGKEETLDEMGTPCEDCPAVEVSKGTTSIRLYNPEKVEFMRTE